MGGQEECEMRPRPAFCILSSGICLFGEREVYISIILKKTKTHEIVRRGNGRSASKRSFLRNQSGGIADRNGDEGVLQMYVPAVFRVRALVHLQICWTDCRRVTENKQ